MTKIMHAQITPDKRVITRSAAGYTVTLVSPAQEDGASPVELLLNALAGCVGLTTSAILRKMHQDIETYTLKITGELSDGRPQVYTTIHIEHFFNGPAITERNIQRAITLTEANCPVEAMLSKAAQITHSYHINE